MVSVKNSMILKIVVKIGLLKASSFTEDHCKLCLIEYCEKSRQSMLMLMRPELF